MEVSQAVRLKALEHENANLKRLLSDTIGQGASVAALSAEARLQLNERLSFRRAFIFCTSQRPRLQDGGVTPPLARRRHKECDILDRIGRDMIATISVITDHLDRWKPTGDLVFGSQGDQLDHMARYTETLSIR